MIEERRYGTNPLRENQIESEGMVEKQKRYSQIIETLKESINPLTAKEIAVIMWKKGYIPTSERNYTAPRITELLKDGKLECIGKKKCEYSNKNVGVFKLREESNEI